MADVTKKEILYQKFINLVVKYYFGRKSAWRKQC